MSNNIDQENPSANEDNTDPANVRDRNGYFRDRLESTKFLQISTLPNLSEKNEKCNGN